MGITRPDTTMIDGVSPVSSAAERMRRYRERRTRGLSCITVEPSTEALQPPTQPSASNGISEDRRGFVGYVDGRFVHYCRMRRVGLARSGRLSAPRPAWSLVLRGAQTEDVKEHK